MIKRLQNINNVTTNHIFTDVDGVLLDWVAGFDEWMKYKGYTKVEEIDKTVYGRHVHYGLPKEEIKNLVAAFNESCDGVSLKPFRDANLMVSRLWWTYNFRFSAITSFSNRPNPSWFRAENLKDVFEFAFENVICLGEGSDKDEILYQVAEQLNLKSIEDSRKRNLFWVEDKLENALAGANLGFQTFLMNEPHNQNKEPHPNIIRVDSWKEISDLILNK